MSRTVGDYLVVRLREWGISRVYGYPGDAKVYLSSLLKGDPIEAGIIKPTIKDVADTILPHR